MNRRAGVLALTCLLVMVAGIAASAAAASPSPSGSATSSPWASVGAILFMHPDADGLQQVWKACPDLSHRRQLTSGPNARAGWPSWSPDGTRIAYNTDLGAPGWTRDTEGLVWDIYTMDAEGGHAVNLTTTLGLTSDPSFSPDGRLLAFTWDLAPQSGVYVMDAANGANLRLVTPTPQEEDIDLAVKFSPDGDRLSFARYYQGGSAGSALYAVKLDGSDLTQLTPPSFGAGDSDWSDDGTTILFEADPSGSGRGGPWVINADGTGVRSLTEPVGPDPWIGYSDPIWSPDSSRIMVARGLHYADGHTTSGLATMLPDGTDIQPVSDGLGDEHQVEWSGTATC